ncbi:MAG: hypothetical protein CVU90_12005 [Firmicutes bacterium HGW-Firmicutes-15]|nr:MAG: hypothetical protein CVU90_12005 [Firmicutes bacterium HGW-Firmicutes-15]
MAQTLPLIFIDIILLVLGQVLWKMGVSRIGVLQLDNVLTALTSPLIWTGIGLYGLATIIWLIVLSRANLSTVYPMQSMAYVFGMMGGIFFFGERVPIIGWVGIAFILLGVFLTSTGLK